MSSPIQILHLDDDPIDSELIAAALSADGLDCSIEHVSNRNQFEQSIRAKTFSVVLADYSVPGFDGLSALEVAKAHSPEVPFIFVSGFIGEEGALESLKRGAIDYVFKHNLARLVPAIRRALELTAQRGQTRHAQIALEESEAALRSFFDTAPFLMGIIETLPEDIRLVNGNRATAEFFQTPPGNLRGKLATELGMTQADVHVWRNHCREAAAIGTAVKFESTLARVDAKPCHLSVTVCELPAANLAQRFCYVASDITTKKQLDKQFLRAQRMESAGTLAGGIADDLNNVLAPIQMWLRLFRPRLPAPEDQELLYSLESSAERGAEIVRKVLTFARGQDGERSVLDFPKIIGDLARIVRETYPRSIEVATQLDPDLWRVEGDPTQIHQVLMHLCDNARDAMPQGGGLRITAVNSPAPAGLPKEFDSSTSFVQLSVADTGTGIHKELVDKVFDPFFTTKERGRGTGLGLSTVLSTIKGHGGYVDLETEETRGTAVHLYLPAKRALGDPTPDLSSNAASVGKGEMLLVIDDEAAVRLGTRRVLEEAGYRVLTAKDGSEGVGIFTQNPDQIHLVLTDMMMPVMDGTATIHALRQIDPQLSIIVMSGLAQFVPELGPDDANYIFVQKPFLAESLLAAVQRLITRSRRTSPS